MIPKIDEEIEALRLHGQIRSEDEDCVRGDFLFSCEHYSFLQITIPKGEAMLNLPMSKDRGSKGEPAGVSGLSSYNYSIPAMTNGKPSIMNDLL